jgi:DNA-binding transcriptional MerR regulator
MRHEALKVGELAGRTGLTVRTLHHYDEIGLLRPSLHTDTGHRLYTPADVARLQQVLSLRQLGFSLEEIRNCLDQPGFSPVEVIRLQVGRLRKQIEMQQQLCVRLEGLAAYFGTAEAVSAEAFLQFLQTIEVMTMIENYYTPEQMEYFRKRREAGGAALEERAKQAQALWAQLLADYRIEMEKGTDPADPRLRELEKRRQALVDEFTGGDRGVEESLTRLWKEQGDKLAAQFGYDPKVVEYLGKVVEAAKGSG